MTINVNLVQSMQRRLKVRATFLRYGFDILISQEQMQDVRQFLIARLGYRPNEFSNLSVPARVRLMLEELGPTFIKLGQVVSSQTQSLPLDWREELEHLQNNVPPFSYEQVQQVFIDSLNAPPEEIYATFDEQPLAAASIGQVHRATLKTGEVVAVKVQRPGIRPDINEDLALLFDTARLLEQTTTWAKNFDVVGVVQKFAAGLHEELDYLTEAQYADRLREAMRMTKGVRAPYIYRQYTTSEILTMEFVHGVKITNTAALDAAGVDRATLADRFIQAMVQQIIVDGYFHADPHPGNVMVDPRTGDIIFLDTGMMDFLMEDQREVLTRLLIGMHERDVAEVTRCAILLGTIYKELDEPALRRAMARLLGRYLSADLADVAFGEVIGKILTTLFTHGVRLSSELTLAVKALVQMEQIAHTLNPALSMSTIVETVLREVVDQKLTVDAFIDNLKRTAREAARMAPEVRDGIEMLIQQAKQGKATIQFDTSNLNPQLQALDVIANRLTLGVSLTGITVGSAIVLHASSLEDQPLLRKLGAGGFAFAMIANGAMIGVVLRDIWRTQRSKA